MKAYRTYLENEDKNKVVLVVAASYEAALVKVREAYPGWEIETISQEGEVIVA